MNLDRVHSVLASDDISTLTTKLQEIRFIPETSNMRSSTPYLGRKISLLCTNTPGITHSFSALERIKPQFCELSDEKKWTPKRSLVQQRDGGTAIRLLLSITMHEKFLHDLKIPQENKKATLFHYAVNLLIVEAQCVYLLLHYCAAIEECSTVQREQFTLDTTESFAFYLRFRKMIEQLFSGRRNVNGLTATYPFVRKLLEETDHNTSQDLSVKLQRLESHLVASHIAIGQSILDVDTGCSANNEITLVLKKVTPLLGYLVCTCKEQFSHLDIEEGQIIPFHKQYVDWASHIKRTLSLFSRSYFDQQMALYDTAMNNLQTLLQKYPRLQNPPFNFRHSLDKITSLLSVTDFKSHMSGVQQAIFGIQQPVQVTQLTPEEIEALFEDKTTAKSRPFTKKNTRRVANHKPQGAAASPALQTATVQKIPLAFLLLQALKDAPQLTYHKRVRRWLRLDPRKIEDVKSFVDFRQNVPIYQYANLSMEEIQEQVLLHGFTPLVDKVLTSRELKQKYAIKTPSGYSLIIELTQNGKVRRGIAAYGFDEVGRCYHRMIEFRHTDEFYSLPLSNVAKTRLEESPPEDTYEAHLLEQFSGFEGDTFEVDQTSEILRFIDLKNRCIVAVFSLFIE